MLGADVGLFVNTRLRVVLALACRRTLDSPT
jgi:hypothetical protein